MWNENLQTHLPAPMQRPSLYRSLSLFPFSLSSLALMKPKGPAATTRLCDSDLEDSFFPFFFAPFLAPFPHSLLLLLSSEHSQSMARTNMECHPSGKGKRTFLSLTLLEVLYFSSNRALLSLLTRLLTTSHQSQFLS